MPYLTHTDADREAMLKTIGVSSVEELLTAIPQKVKLAGNLKLPSGLSEWETRMLLMELAQKNHHTQELTCFIGGGVYDRYVPAVVDHLASRSEFYTAYTPYQPEISQGTLQAVFEYQTMICMITGMDVSNASLYDGATAMAEGVCMACRITGRKEVAVSNTVNPLYRNVLDTYARDLDIVIKEIPASSGVADLNTLSAIVSEATAAVVLQNPNFFGHLEELSGICDQAHQKGALALAVVDPISLGILKSPGETGIDIAVGEGQGLGNYLNFGGPYLGFMAVKEKYMRGMPGRIVGQTTDKSGKRAFVLTLQAREQHIRREKATSNICSNEALCALRAAIYLSLLGKKGFHELSGLCAQKAHYLASQITSKTKFRLAFASPFFQEFTLKSPLPVKKVLAELRGKGILGGIALGDYYPELPDHLLVSVTEKRSKQEMDRLVEGLVEIL